MIFFYLAMDIIDRIQQIINKEGLNVSSFARRIGVVDQSVRGIVVQRRNNPGYEIIYKIIQTFDWVDAEWLITGKGEMTKSVSERNQQTHSLGELVQYLREKDKRIEQLIEEKTELKIKFEISRNKNVIINETKESLQTSAMIAQKVAIPAASGEKHTKSSKNQKTK